jgi:hypothetical protein
MSRSRKNPIREVQHTRPSIFVIEASGSWQHELDAGLKPTMNVNFIWIRSNPTICMMIWVLIPACFG